jgi:phosphomannomutase
VGRDTLLEVFSAAGYPEPVVVPLQAEPDGAFPTVAFPNPEEAGALDLLIETANAANVDLAIANDPDADRLSVSVRVGDEWQTLTGDEVGVLLADHVLREGSSSERRLVVTTLVSSRLLSRMAAAYQVEFAQTLTGFKWIADAARKGREEQAATFAFGYEEALGYCIGELVADKDGISAALLFCELAAVEAQEGRSVADRLDALALQYGVFATRQQSVRFGGPDWKQAGLDAVSNLRIAAIAAKESGATDTFADRAVVDIAEPSGNMVVVTLDDDTRLTARPSGTEPKLKFYVEVVQQVIDGDVSQARAMASVRLGQEFAGIEQLAGISFKD